MTPPPGPDGSPPSSGVVPGSTTIGIVGGAEIAAVDTTGTCRLGRAGDPTIEWWIGAEDRWHRPAVEAAVRQSPAGDGITVETRCKVPGGDVVHRAAAVPSRGSVFVRADVENATPVPVAIAVVVAMRRAGSVTVADDTVLVDGRPVLRAGRSIARVLVRSDLDVLATDLDAGAAVPPAEVAGPMTGSVVAAVFPVPHTAVLSVVAPAGFGTPGAASVDTSVGLPAPADLPPLDAVARGWEAHLEAATRVTLPDPRLVRAVAAARRHLLSLAAVPQDAPVWSSAPGWASPVAAAALDAWGHADEALDLLLAATGPDDPVLLPARPVPDAAALLWAWAERLERRPDPELAASLVPVVEQLVVGMLDRRPRMRLLRRAKVGDAVPHAAWRAIGLTAAASLLTRAGEAMAGADIVDALPALLDDLGLRGPGRAAGDGSGPGRAAGDGSGGAVESSVPLALGGRRLDLDPAQVPRLPDALASLLGLPRSEPSPAPAATPGPQAEGSTTLTAVAAATSAVGALGSGHDPAASALLLLAVRRSLVDEPDGPGGAVALLPQPEAEWLGAAVEVHGAPVAGGAVSFAMRWHGERPAVLWELAASGPAAVPLTSPGLDPRWRHEPSTADAASPGTWKGEALLAATVGLRLGGAMESPTVRRGETLDVDDDPGSFA